MLLNNQKLQRAFFKFNAMVILFFSSCVGRDEKLYGCSQDTHRSKHICGRLLFAGKKWFSLPPIKLGNYNRALKAISTTLKSLSLCICGFHFQVEKASTSILGLKGILLKGAINIIFDFVI